MAVVSDIEEVNRTRKDRASFVSSIDSSFRTGGETDEGTSKSGSRIRINFDPSMLELVNGTDDGSCDSDETYKDPVFGSCCDLVKVCLIVDIIYIIQKINVIITIVMGVSVLDPDDLNLREYMDDEIQAEVARLDAYNLMLIVKEAVGIPFAAIGILGAKYFWKYLVLCMAIWCCGDLVWSIATQRWLSSLYVAFYIYPHFALFFALKSSRISRDNYDEVKHCCCAKYCCSTSSQDED